MQFPDLPLAHTGGQFAVQLADNSEVSEVNRVTPDPVRVFNRDYINTNFQAEHTAPAVFIVGQENLELRARLDKIRVAQKSLNTREQQRQSQIDRVTSEDGTAGTSCASAIGSLLGVRDFRRPDLNRRMQQVRNDSTSFLLTEDRRQAYIETFRSGDQFTAIASTFLSIPDLSTEIENVRVLLARTASFDAIQGLSDNPDLEDWLRTGYGLHTGSDTCQFCGSSLPEDRLAALQHHFSTASQELLVQIDRRIEHLNSVSFDAPRLTALEFLQEVRDDARQELVRLSDWLTFADGVRQSLVSSLQEKRMALESQKTWNGDEGRSAEGVTILTTLQRYIQLHNERVQNMGTVKSDARTAIERHFAAVHFEEQHIAIHEMQMARLRRKIASASAARERLAHIAQQIDEQINRAVRGAERFMELVGFLLRDSEIRVESRGESQFQLMRGDDLADKLSDGEMTAIAFAYFVTSLEGDGEELTRTIVYVDDPISSLDSNHVYAVFALIQERLEPCLQLFVSTHNSEFFNLLKDRWIKNNRLSNQSEAFYVRRSEDATGAFSVLERLPDLLRKYGSEYQFIFSQLHTFANATTPSDFEAYAAPNMLRRFLEAYLGFQKPDVVEWHKKLDLIFDTPEEAREVHKLLDDASHLQRLGRALHEPAFVAIAQSRVRAVFSGLEQKDPRHFNSMVAVVS